MTTEAQDRPSDSWHRLTDLREAACIATCSICGGDTPVKFRKHGSRSGHWACANKSRSRPPRPPEQKRRANLRRQYGLTVEHYEAMHALQNGGCAICGGVNENGRRLHVDHCHRTGDIRGLLCNRCNFAIGLMRDDPARLAKAIDYLERAF